LRCCHAAKLPSCQAAKPTLVRFDQTWQVVDFARRVMVGVELVAVGVGMEEQHPFGASVLSEQQHGGLHAQIGMEHAARQREVAQGKVHRGEAHHPRVHVVAEEGAVPLPVPFPLDEAVASPWANLLPSSSISSVLLAEELASRAW
jgi:hypothetical protein